MQHKRKPGRITPSPCIGCTSHCRNDMCRRWKRWFSESWELLQEMFE